LVDLCRRLIGTLHGRRGTEVPRSRGSLRRDPGRRAAPPTAGG